VVDVQHTNVIPRAPLKRIQCEKFCSTFIEKIAGSFSNITNDEFVQLFGDCTLSDAVCIGLTFVGLPPRFCVAMAPVHNTTS